jgi:hypothetical protein
VTSCVPARQKRGRAVDSLGERVRQEIQSSVKAPPGRRAPKEEGSRETGSLSDLRPLAPIRPADGRQAKRAADVN